MQGEPSEHAGLRDEANSCSVLLKLNPVKLLCKHVGRIVLSIAIFNRNLPLKHTFPDEMIFAFDMLRLGVKGWILCKTNSPLIVAMEM